MYYNLTPTTLNGWFDGFCPSNGIADDFTRKAKGVWAQEKNLQSQIEALKNGKQAAEWENLKNHVRKLDDELKELNRELEKEKAIAAGIGVDMTALGAWCNGAVSRRKKAEASLREAEKALGIVKGALSTLMKQQGQGIVETAKVIQINKKKIEQVKGEIQKVQNAIEVFKAERDNERKELAKNQTEKDKALKSDLMGKVKDNLPLIIAGTAVIAAGVVHYRRTKKSKKKTVKKVEA
ncbi:hypothetical protein [uncultured Tenacibaculum sp.]|uniref:hypothetical protein n=1 Tax=uncultured Tenacibaculum sp. TaxID=174713 RepID=UPI002637220B|nr:hypothetical protein [uncultured Tenacibaculum sp.]